jgi:lysine-specific histone demethylase 1B
LSRSSENLLFGLPVLYSGFKFAIYLKGSNSSPIKVNMKKRNFLNQSALLSLGGMLAPAAFLSSCTKKDPLKGLNYSGKVLIIGAGAAGLYAGYILKSKGVDFEILEASSSYGGRLGKLTNFANFPLDLGAQWLHGKKSVVGDLVQNSNTKITLDDSKSKYWFHKKLVTQLPQNVNIFEGDNLPDLSYKAFAMQKGLGNEYQFIVENIAADQGAAASKISVLYNNIEEKNWSSGGDDFKFQETYFDLIDIQIAQAVKDKIQLSTLVKKIDYTQSKITVTDSNNKSRTADKVIITVPITILQSNDIQFIPALPAEKTSAFSKIGMGAGMKVFLRFNKKFFDQNIIGGTVCAAYADESVGKSIADTVLLAFIMGDQADYLTSLGTDAAITSALLQELDGMYNGQATASFIAAHVQNYTTHPFIRGAYSYSTIGMGDARKIAAQSVDKKLFFGGEAMNVNGHHQTVHGAVETGFREVVNIFNSI